MPIGFTYRLDTRGLNRLSRRIRTEGQQIVRESAEAIRADIVINMHAEKHGQTVKIRTSVSEDGTAHYKAHQRSAPGEAPAVDTSTLVNAVDVDQMEWHTAIVHTGDNEYAAPLEFGAPSRNLEPRPFMRPAFEREFPNFKQNVQRLME